MPDRTLPCTVGVCDGGNCTDISAASSNASDYCPFRYEVAFYLRVVLLVVNLSTCGAAQRVLQHTPRPARQPETVLSVICSASHPVAGLDFCRYHSQQSRAGSGYLLYDQYGNVCNRPTCIYPLPPPPQRPSRSRPRPGALAASQRPTPAHAPTWPASRFPTTRRPAWAPSSTRWRSCWRPPRAECG